jgi:hypothetical protein
MVIGFYFALAGWALFWVVMVISMGDFAGWCNLVQVFYQGGVMVREGSDDLFVR